MPLGIAGDSPNPIVGIQLLEAHPNNYELQSIKANPDAVIKVDTTNAITLLQQRVG